jgi:uncharacterized membrane protein HdeD (DUF308 family)
MTHGPDMPLYPGGPEYGLGLWNSVAATMMVETVMFVAGVWMYLQATRARDRIGRWALLSLIAFLAIAYMANANSNPPPSVTAIVIGAIVGATVLTAWSWWADRHRDVILTGTPARTNRALGTPPPLKE